MEELFMNTMFDDAVQNIVENLGELLNKKFIKFTIKFCEKLCRKNKLTGEEAAELLQVILKFYCSKRCPELEDTIEKCFNNEYDVNVYYPDDIIKYAINGGFRCYIETSSILNDKEFYLADGDDFKPYRFLDSYMINGRRYMRLISSVYYMCEFNPSLLKISEKLGGIIKSNKYYSPNAVEFVSYYEMESMKDGCSYADYVFNIDVIDELLYSVHDDEDKDNVKFNIVNIIIK